MLPSLQLRREVVLHRGGWPQGKAQHGVGLFSSFRGLDSSVSLSLAPLSLLGLMVICGGELLTQGSEPVIWQFCCFCRSKVGAQLQVCPKRRGGPVWLRPGVPSKGSRVGGHGMLDPGYTTRVCSAEIWMVRWVPCDPRSSHPSLWKGLKFWLGLLGAPVTRVSPGRTLGIALFSQPS